MSLLDKATIITTPTAHSNGKLHSIKGGSVADFDVVRGSAATRVNAEGLIEDISIIGGELVNNGSFDTDLSGWSLTGTNATNTITWETDGVRIISTDGNIGILQTSVLTIGKAYRFTCDVATTTGAIALDGAVSGTTINLVDGSNEIYFTATSTTFKIKRVTTTTNCLLDNISVKEITDATNIPRIDYTTGEGVILTEPQSTNLIAYSEDFSQWSFIGATISSNALTSPSGSLNAAKLVEGTLLSQHRIQFTTTSALGDNTFSVFAKKGERDTLWLRIGTSSGYFNLNDGTATGNIGITPSTIDYGNGWYRCIINKANSAANEICRINITGGDYLGDGTSGVYIWGASYEASSYATSYIPTSGAIATRLADRVTGAGDSSTFNSTEGVLYANIASLSNTVIANYIAISDGTYDNRLSISYSSGTNIIRTTLRLGGFAEADMNFVVSDITDFHKVAFKYKENDFALWIDGVKVRTDTSGSTLPSGTLTDLSFSEIGANGNKFLGKTKTIAVFSEALTDAELTCLTTI